MDYVVTAVHRGILRIKTRKVIEWSPVIERSPVIKRSPVVSSYNQFYCASNKDIKYHTSFSGAWNTLKLFVVG